LIFLGQIMDKKLPFLLLVFLVEISFAQIGGSDSYRFLQMSNSARINALGGANISALSEDVSAVLYNPGLLNERMHQGLSFNHQFYFAGIQSGYFAYGHHLGGQHDITLHTGFQYINYGDFRWTDEFDQTYGTFGAGEFAWTVGGSMQVYDRLRVGSNLKIINSNMESYSSFAVGLDLGAVYHIEESDFTIGMAISNIGAPLTKYTDTGDQRMPYDVRLGISKKLPKAPFRFSVTAHNLHRWNLTYDNPEAVERNTLFADLEPEDKPLEVFVDNFFRHLIFASEILIGKQENFKIFVGYNHFRRRELNVLGFRAFNGFSAGVALKVKKFEVGYGFGTFHLAGSSHQISITTNLQRFTRDVILD